MSRSSMLLAVPLALASILAIGCGDDSDPKAYLGPVEAGPQSDASSSVEPGSSVSTLAIESCESSPVLEGPDVLRVLRNIAALESRTIVAGADHLHAFRLDERGCPGTALESFGNDGALEFEGISAVPLPAGRVLAAEKDRTVLLDSTGKEVSRCLSNGEPLIARFLHADDDGNVSAAFSKSPIALLSLEVTTTQCTAQPVAFQPEPYALVAVALGEKEGFVAVEQATPSSAMVVARYDSDGNRVASSSVFTNHEPSRLCSATGLIDTFAGVFVTDTLCKRVVLFDSEKLYAIAEFEFEKIPRAAALVSKGKKVLIGLVETQDNVEQAATASFMQVILP